MKVHEALISMAVGAILFAPLTGTAQAPAPVVNSPFGSNQQVAQLQQQVADLQNKLADLNKRVDGVTKVAWDHAGTLGTVTNDIHDLKNRVSAAEKQNSAQSQTETNITNRVIALESAHQHHVHAAFSDFSMVTMPLWNCTSSGCTIKPGTTVVLVPKNPYMLTNLLTSKPIPLN